MKTHEVVPADHSPGKHSAICMACGLCNTGIISPFIVPCTTVDDSSIQSFYLIVGEAPGKDEDAAGEAFVGQAGSILARGLDAAGADNWRASCIKDNVVRCRPAVRTQWGSLKNRKPSQKEAKYCSQFLFADIVRYQPKAILLLGDTALRAVLGLTKITEKRRRVFFLGIADMHIPCVPAFHPATVLYDGNQQERFNQDIKYFVDTCIKGVQSARPNAVEVAMNIQPTAADIQTFHKACLQKDLTAAVDVEADELLVYTSDDWRLLCIGVSNGTHTLVVPVDRCGVEHEGERVFGVETAPAVAAMLDLLTDQKIKKLVGHNVKYDKHALLRRFGIHLVNVGGDTLAEHALLYPIVGGHDLDTVASEILGMHGIKQESQEAMGLKQNDPRAFGRLSYDVLATRCGNDCYATWRIHELLSKRLHKATVIQPDSVLSLHDTYRRIVVPALSTLFDMETTGVHLDQTIRAQKEVEYNTELERLVREMRNDKYVKLFEAERGRLLMKEYRDKVKAGSRVKPATFALHMKESVPWKPGSPGDVRAILFGGNGTGFGLQSNTKTPSGAESTDDDALAAIVTSAQCSDEAKAFAASIREYRTRRTILSTFIVGVKDYIGVDGQIHPTFNLGVTRTGRLSSSDPNLQNIPKRFDDHIRGMYTVRKSDHALVSGDYSQIELRVLAAYSGDQTMSDAFHHGDDLHMLTARKITGKEEADVQPMERRAAKTINFGVIYGLSAVGLSDALSREFERSVSIDESQTFINEYFDLYPGVAQWIHKIQRFAMQHGCVYTMFGRRRDLANAARKGRDRDIIKLREEALRQAVNTPVQGTASDIALTAAIALHGVYKKLEQSTGLFCQIVVSVHDELLTECHKSLVDRVLKIKQHIMCKVPVAFLGDKLRGIPVCVDLKVGKSWDNLKALTKQE